MGQNLLFVVLKYVYVIFNYLLLKTRGRCYLLVFVTNSESVY